MAAPCFSDEPQFGRIPVGNRESLELAYPVQIGPCSQVHPVEYHSVNEGADGLLDVAARLERDASAGEELVGDALYRGAVRLRTLRENGAAEIWFCRILVNLWRDRVRGGRRRERPLDDLPEPAAPPRFDPAARASARELRERVREAVWRLPPAQKLAIVLRVDEGLSLAEIARLLETTADRVKANLWHARKRLRRELRDLLDVSPEREDG